MSDVDDAIGKAGEHVETLRMQVFGAWLFETPYPMNDEHRRELCEKGTLAGVKLVHLIPGEHKEADLPALRQQFLSCLPKVFDPRYYAILLGLGDGMRLFPLPDIKKEPRKP